MLTSGAGEVKLGLAVREDEEVVLPWLVPTPPVSETRDGWSELIASGLAGNGFVNRWLWEWLGMALCTGEHGQVRTGCFSPHGITPGWRVAEMCWSLISSATPQGRASTSQQIFL